MIGEKWMKWTFAEAGTKTASKMLQKVIGSVSATFGHVFFATLAVGMVQVMAGSVMAARRGKKLLTDWKSISGSCLFGLFAALSTVLSFAVFASGGDIGVNTFIITMSIVPGALIDRFCFGYKLNWRQWVGVLLAILAGYSVLGWPPLAQLLALPLWVWLSLIIMCSVAINQGITQKIKGIDPYVKNFWGGLTTLVLAFAGTAVLGSLKLFADHSKPMQYLWLASLIGGLIVVAMWNFNLLSYKGGASIALKKLVMNGTYLISAMLLSALIFGESLTVGKLSGIAIYFAAFALMDEGTWKYISGLFRATQDRPLSVVSGKIPEKV